MKHFKVILAVLVVAFAQLQTLHAQNTRIGFRGGISGANVAVPQLSDVLPVNPEGIEALQAALFFNYEIMPGFSVQPELAYARKGFQIREGFDLNIFNIEVPVGARAVTKLDYIELPVLAKYEIGQGPVTAYVMAGPSLGYAVDGRLETKATFLLDFNVSESDINLDNDIYNRWEVAAVGGAGVNFNFPNNSSLFIEGRYQHGLTDMLDDPVVDLKMKNKSIGVHVGLAKWF